MTVQQAIDRFILLKKASASSPATIKDYEYCFQVR